MQSRSIPFPQISNAEPIREVIKEAFDTDIEISGGWGYSISDAVILPDNLNSVKQLQHTIATMRAHLEMNLTQPPENSYGGINLNEISRENIRDNGINYSKVSYRASAMKESDYEKFIDEYKEGSMRDDFDLESHFDARKKATIHREINVWFVAN